jgi:hypothetical protein
LNKQSSILAFISITEPRKDSLIKYTEAIGSEVIDINENTLGFNGIPKEFAWLVQLLYGQHLALELSKRLGTNPDTVRADESPYNKARSLVTLSQPNNQPLQMESFLVLLEYFQISNHRHYY